MSISFFLSLSPLPTHNSNEPFPTAPSFDAACLNEGHAEMYRFGIHFHHLFPPRLFFGARDERERSAFHARTHPMDGKKEDGYLLGVSPRSTTPPRATLAQLAEERLGSLQYLLQSKNGVSSSPPSRNRPRASTATSTGGTGRAAGRVRRSASGNVEEAAGDGSSVARSRGLFSSAPNVASRER